MDNTYQKRQIDYDDLVDFGFKENRIQNGKVEYISCSLDENLNSSINNQLEQSGDLSSGAFFSLNDILSGGVSTIDSYVVRSQAELALNDAISTSLAYFGSLYTTVQIAINDIRENYPNGFMVSDAITGVNALMFNSSDISTYGGVKFKTINNLNYEIVQTYNGVYDKTFQIIQEITGTTFSLFLELDGQPSDGSGYSHILQPNQEYLDKYYSTLSKYSLNLLVPPYYRTNYWPRDPVSPSNILLDGEDYDDFIDSELSWAELADNEESNFIWRKLYPDGQKNLDSDDGLMQRLVLTFAMNFDNIKRYQDQLKYQHTIGYDQYNHISKDVVWLLSNQWNWDVGHTLNQDDYSEYIYSLYENYVSGQSQQKISSRDVNFEIQRRVLSNLVTLYKKKGTREAIKYIANMYGLPEELFVVEELVSTNDNEIVESESNIIIPINGVTYYINDIGSATTLTYGPVKNTKFLNINISPIDAIEFDFYDWGSTSHPNITNINGISTQISGSSNITKRDFFNKIYSNTIKSDGSSRYESRYPLLENEGVIYYASSTNKLSLHKLDPYINFLDDNWNILIGNLVPASSKILSIGTMYKNPMWMREKFKWNISELEEKSLPVNETIVLPNISVNINIENRPSAIISIENPVAIISDKLFTSLDSPEIVSRKIPKLESSIGVVSSTSIIDSKKYSSIQIGNMNDSSYVENVYDSDSVNYEYTSQTYYTSSPIFEPIGSEYGSLDYTNYNENSLIVTNKKTVDIPFTAYNLSDSGCTTLKFELFSKQYDNSVIIDENIKYKISEINYETDNVGSYNVSTLKNISTNDYISVTSNYSQYLNKIVLVTYVDSGSTQIRTSPSIGFSNIPLGENNSSLNWSSFKNSGAIQKLFEINKEVSIQNIISVISGMINGLTIQDNFSNLNLTNNSLYLFSWFENKSVDILKSTLILLNYILQENKYDLSTKDSILISGLLLSKSNPEFKRVVDFFDWNSPVQSLTYSNYSSGSSEFILPELDIESRSSNTFSTSGNVTIGGLNELNSDILVDKTEYFYRYKCETHAPLNWGVVDGLSKFIPSGGTLLESDYDIRRINNITYYGRYFTFIRTPKMPNASILNIIDNELPDASVTSILNGVGDSDRLELQFLEVTSSGSPYSSYTQIPESAWTSTSGTIIPIEARKNIGDDYIYTIQTTLNGDTYYWWRVKNFRGKFNIFRNNLECSTSSKPTWFKTGEFVNIGGNEGEIPEEPIPPKKIGNVPDITS